MEPVHDTILKLVNETGPNPLLDALRCMFRDPNPDWVYPSCE